MIFLIIVGLIVVGAGFWAVGIGQRENSPSIYLSGLLLCFGGGGLIGTGVTFLAGWG